MNHGPVASHKRRAFSRRQALIPLCVSMGILFLVTVQAQETARQCTETIGEEQESATPAKHQVAFTTFEGARVEVKAETGRLSFDLQLGRDSDRTALPISGNGITAQDTQKLLDVSGAFVSPRQLYVIGWGRDGCLITVSFGFLGEEDEKRRIRMSVVLKDEDGTTLGEITHECGDARLYQEPPRVWGSQVVEFVPISSPSFDLPRVKASDVRKCSIVFEHFVGVSEGTEG